MNTNLNVNFSPYFWKDSLAEKGRLKRIVVGKDTNHKVYRVPQVVETNYHVLAQWAQDN